MSPGLAEGSTVAVLGGGLTGAATALALLTGARVRGRGLEVVVFHPEHSESRPPLVLTQECRARLSALGCKISADLKDAELEAVEVVCGEKRARLPARDGIWVLDGRGERLGRERLQRGLRALAVLNGARFVRARVERLEALEQSHEAPNEATLVVRSSQPPTRCNAAVLASGTHFSLGGRFFTKFSESPALPTAFAWVRTGTAPSSWTVQRETAVLLLGPCPGIDGLWLIPCRGAVFASAFGRAASQVSLCLSLMVAARGGHLRPGFTVERVSAGQVSVGVARTLVGQGQLAVGPSALGHPLALGVAPALATCTRAAVALLDGGIDAKELGRRYVKEGLETLREEAVAASRAFRWLVRAGDRAPGAVLRAARLSPLSGGHQSGALGLSPTGLLFFARRAGLMAAFSRAFLVDEAAAEPAPVPEPNLFYVVEDDPPVREALCAYLQRRGAQVIGFSDELALCAAVAQRPPAAILLDVVLPRVDGLRVCEELKRHPSTRAVRILVTSGLDLACVRKRALRAGAEAFLAKPIVPAVLWATLTGRIDEGERASTGSPLAVNG